MDTYANFAALSAVEREGRDYQVVRRRRPTSQLAIIAPHGGGIEPGTSVIARLIAAGEHNLYLFEGLKRTGNSTLHITSHRFDEPRCLQLLKRCDTALAVHGCSGKESRIVLGGLDYPLIERVRANFKRARLPVTDEDDGSFPGEEPGNICNRSAKGSGVQVEISIDLRQDPASRRRIASAVRLALEN